MALMVSCLTRSPQREKTFKNKGVSKGRNEDKSSEGVPELLRKCFSFTLQKVTNADEKT